MVRRVIPVEVVPLSPLDERFLASSRMWEALRPTMSFVLGPPSADVGSDVDTGPDQDRRPGLDMDEVRQLFEALSIAHPRLRRRIMTPLLGLHAPAWVPDDSFDIGWHVRHYPDVIDADAIPDKLLAGFENGPMHQSRPPWDVLVADLTDGGAMVALRYHHVLGDGLFGRALAMSMLALARPLGLRQPGPPSSDVRAPVNRISLMAASFRVFRAEYQTAPVMWRRFSRSTVRTRMRRVVARNIRPVRNRMAIRQDPRTALALDRQPRRLALDLSTARKFARGSGGGVGDFTAAVVAAALTRLNPNRGSIGVLIPVSGRDRGDDSAGNRVRVIKVVLPASTDVPRLTSAVAERVSAAVKSNDFPAVPPGSWDAYTTFVPGPPRTPTILGRTAVWSTAWPTMDPREGYAVFASSCGPHLEFGMMIGHGVDADLLLAEIRQVLIEQDLIERVEVPA